MNFICLVPSDTFLFGWLVDGVSAFAIGKDKLAKGGITYASAVVTENNRTFTMISIEPRTVNDNTVLSCSVVLLDAAPQVSRGAVFRVQGKYMHVVFIFAMLAFYCQSLCPDLLAAPTALEIRYFNSTHEELMWEEPYTLNLTDILHDITGYTITIIMSHPPPSYPYDLSVILDQLPHTSNLTYNISHNGQVTFLRYTFPVWLGIRAENPVGLGATSPPLKYTSNTTTDDCVRLHGEMNDRDHIHCFNCVRYGVTSVRQ